MTAGELRYAGGTPVSNKQRAQAGGDGRETAAVSHRYGSAVAQLEVALRPSVAACALNPRNLERSIPRKYALYGQTIPPFQ